MMRTRIRNLAYRLGVLPVFSRTLNVARRMKRAARPRKAESLPQFAFQSTIGLHFRPHACSTGLDSRRPGTKESLAVMDRSGFPYQADYSHHPAFVEHLVWDGSSDSAVDEVVDWLNEQLLDLEAMLSLKLTTLPNAIEKVNAKVGLLVNLLVAANDATGADFRPFAKTFHLEILRVMIDDLAYFVRRNSYEPVINNATELALRNELAINGFLEWDLKTDELDALRHQLKRYAELIESRYQQGLRSREELSTNEIDPESIAMVSGLFERRGLNKAVSNVRHEVAMAGGFAFEISPDDNDWWHSRYEDVGLLASNQAAYFHNDESRDVYKAIIYLDDVDDGLGPFCYLPQSYSMKRPRFEWIVARANLTTLAADEMRPMMSDLRPSRGVFTSRAARRFFGMLPRRLRLNSHFGFDALDDSELSRLLQSQEVRMIAPAGHVIAFDGSRIVHRGGLVRGGRRTAIQVSFEVQKQNGGDLFREVASRLVR
jgi:hypothetical protein